jgi:hypothetical protein
MLQNEVNNLHTEIHYIFSSMENAIFNPLVFRNEGWVIAFYGLVWEGVYENQWKKIN